MGPDAMILVFWMLSFKPAFSLFSFAFIMRIFQSVQLLSRVWLCVTPETVAPQAPPSLGFSRQEHWSGSPLPSPLHETEKWKWSRSSRVRLLATPWTAAYHARPTMGFSRQEYWSGVPLPSLWDHFIIHQYKISTLFSSGFQLLLHFSLFSGSSL